MIILYPSVNPHLYLQNYLCVHPHPYLQNYLSVYICTCRIICQFTSVLAELSVCESTSTLAELSVCHSTAMLAESDIYSFQNTEFPVSTDITLSHETSRKSQLSVSSRDRNSCWWLIWVIFLIFADLCSFGLKLSSSCDIFV